MPLMQPGAALAWPNVTQCCWYVLFDYSTVCVCVVRWCWSASCRKTLSTTKSTPSSTTGGSMTRSLDWLSRALPMPVPLTAAYVGPLRTSAKVRVCVCSLTQALPLWCYLISDCCPGKLSTSCSDWQCNAVPSDLWYRWEGSEGGRPRFGTHRVHSNSLKFAFTFLSLVSPRHMTPFNQERTERQKEIMQRERKLGSMISERWFLSAIRVHSGLMSAHIHSANTSSGVVVLNASLFESVFILIATSLD